LSDTLTKDTTTKGKLELLTAFTIMARRALEKLCEECYGPFGYGRDPEILRAALDQIAAETFPEALEEKDPGYYKTLVDIRGALFAQLMLSQQVLKEVHAGNSRRFQHGSLLRDVSDRSEAVLGALLDLAIEGAFDDVPSGRLRA
jgi:D-serine deaminase-like pyridoxal phosphate-dependent protein